MISIFLNFPFLSLVEDKKINFLVNSSLYIFTLTFYSASSMVTKRKVNENNRSSGVDLSDAACSACEMAVVWVQSQIQKNKSQEQILNYVNEVSLHKVNGQRSTVKSKLLNGNCAYFLI